MKKNFNATFQLLGELIYTEEFKVTGGADFLNGRKIIVKKEDKRFNISFKLLPNERSYANVVLDTKLEEFILTSENGLKYIVPIKSTLLTNLKDDNDNYEIDVWGSISQIGTIKAVDIENQYLRLIIPISETSFLFSDFQSVRYETEITLQNKALINVFINEHNFHLFTFKKDGQVFWGVDSTEPISFSKFKEISFSILNAYGFITGKLNLKEAYYICSTEKDFSLKVDLLYTTIRDSLITDYTIFTTSPSSFLIPFFKNQGKPLDHDYIKSWYKKIDVFNEKCFSSLSTLFYEHDAISRAALVVLEANSQPLELKAASYCVAFEGICHTIKKEFGITSPNVVDNELWNNVIKIKFSELIQVLKEENSINEDQERILKNKLSNWNQPTNRDSLTAPFIKFGYKLNDDESKCIGDRNKFLHGSLPVNEKNEDEAFKELFHVALTIHKLIYVLVLKAASFSGHIINYPKFHNNITEKDVDGDLFISI